MDAERDNHRTSPRSVANSQNKKQQKHFSLKYVWIICNMRKKFYLHSIVLLEDIRFFLLIPRNFLSQVRSLLLPPFCFSRLWEITLYKAIAVTRNCHALGINPPNTHPGSFWVGKVVYQNKNKNSNKGNYLCIFLETISFFSLTNLCRTSGNNRFDKWPHIPYIKYSY